MQITFKSTCYWRVEWPFAKQLSFLHFLLAVGQLAATRQRFDWKEVGAVYYKEIGGSKKFDGQTARYTFGTVHATTHLAVCADTFSTTAEHLWLVENRAVLTRMAYEEHFLPATNSLLIGVDGHVRSGHRRLIQQLLIHSSSLRQVLIWTDHDEAGFFAGEMPKIANGLLINTQGICGSQGEKRLILGDAAIQRYKEEVRQQIKAHETELAALATQIGQLRAQQHTLSQALTTVKEAEAFQTTVHERMLRQTKFQQFTATKEQLLQQEKDLRQQLEQLSLPIAACNWEIRQLEAYAAVYQVYASEREQIEQLHFLEEAIQQLEHAILQEKAKEEVLKESLEQKGWQHARLKRQHDDLLFQLDEQKRKLDRTEQLLREKREEYVAQEEEMIGINREQEKTTFEFALNEKGIDEAAPENYRIIVLDEGRKEKVFDLYEKELQRKLIILTPKSHEAEYLYRFSKAYVVSHDPSLPESRVFKVMQDKKREHARNNPLG